MSVTDEIVEEIVAICERDETKKFSREVIYDFIAGYDVIDNFVDGIAEELKAKGIEVV